MDAWNTATHGRSGLVARVRESTVTEAQAQAVLLEFLRPWVPAGKSPMCGNSIGQDRRFMARTMPELESFFHYRNLDVSTIKVLSKQWYGAKGEAPGKPSSHTALDDIRASIIDGTYVDFKQQVLARMLARAS
jgi:oligoribonuclease